MNKSKLGLIKFKPILKDKIWGGQKLKNQFGKEGNSVQIGESWEISEVPDSVSIVEEGSFKNTSLSELIRQYPVDMLGQESIDKFGYQFPILFKFIDAAERLSVQLHPNDEVAKERHQSFGKTEMWYVIDADPEAFIIADFKEKLSPESYQEYLNDGTLVDHLQYIKVKSGDVFYIKPGLIHAIGEGVLLAEIQQTSDITYRIYDWKRKDIYGNYRELHTDIAIDAIDFNIDYKYQIDYQEEQEGVQELLHTDYFKTDYIHVSKDENLKLETHQKFMVLMCIEGEVKLKTGDESSLLERGETIFLPAVLAEATLSSLKNSRLLKVTI